MDKRTIYLVLYVFLLTMTTPALCLKQQLDEQETPERRQAVLAIGAYAGMAVAPYIFAALVAAYGIATVIHYRITKVNTSDRYSMPCEDNRGWCRNICQSHEYVDNKSQLCQGGYDCCLPR